MRARSVITYTITGAAIGFIWLLAVYSGYNVYLPANHYLIDAKVITSAAIPALLVSLFFKDRRKQTTGRSPRPRTGIKRLIIIVITASIIPLLILLGASQLVNIFCAQHQTNGYANPFVASDRGPLAMGIASYGLSSNLTELPQITTNQIYGTANITAFSFYSQSAPAGVSEYGASLQLNAAMQINLNGIEQEFFLQNVAQFNTNNDTYRLISNIFNLTSYGASTTNTTFIGNGAQEATNSDGQTYYVYTFPERGLFRNGWLNYTLPLRIELVTEIRNVPLPVLFNGTEYYPVVSFGYSQLNANGTWGTTDFYDNITFNTASNAANATILIKPKYGACSFYDVEFVFGGQSAGEESEAQQLNAALSLYYLNGSKIITFPYYFQFGKNTGESVDNVTSIINETSGTAWVKTGQPDIYSQLKGKFNISELVNYTNLNESVVK